MPVPANAKPAIAAATQRAYRGDFAHFSAWCDGAGRPPLPAAPDTVAAYLSSLADDLKASMIRRRAYAIDHAHRIAGLEPPSMAEPVKAVLRRIRLREVWARRSAV